MIREVVLLLGSNLENRAKNISGAVSEIVNQIGSITKSSAIYESEAWGFESDQHFLNQVIIIQTDKSPHEVLDIVLGIESKLGRIRDNKSKTYQSRIIDIDLLFYEKLIMKTKNLELPHPQLHNRRFTLVALAELDEKFVHPVYQQPISLLLLKCKDNLWVKKYISE